MPVTAEDLQKWASGHNHETMSEDGPLPGEVEQDEDGDGLPDEEMAPRNILWAGEWDGDPNSITPEMAEELFEFLAENEPAIASAVFDLGAALVGDTHEPEPAADDTADPELGEDEALEGVDELDGDDEPLFGDDEETDDEELEGDEEEEGGDDAEDLFGDDTPAGEDEPFGDDTPAGEDEEEEEKPGEPTEEPAPSEEGARDPSGDSSSSPVEAAKASMMEAVQNLNPEYPEMTPAQRDRAADFIAEEIRAFGHPAKDSPEWKQAVAVGLAKARKEGR